MARVIGERGKTRRSVALLIETSNAYARGVLEGIASYVREHDSWSIYLPEQRRGDAPPSWLSRWKGDGIIARIENRAIAQAVMKTKLPVIDVSAARLVPNIPWVETDDDAIARLAAGHLLERGFRQLAFCGEPEFNWSKWRCEGFCRAVIEAGAECFVYEPAKRGEHRTNWDQEHHRLMDWVKKLPKPIGVMACYDIKAQQLLDACRELSVAVPEEVAVVGVDNDPLFCDLCAPPLSSVMPNTRRTGYVAAQLLDRLLLGDRISNQGNLMKPLGVQTRQSTDVLAIADRDVADAVRYIRIHACEGMKVAELLRAVPLSRRVLESRFTKLVGRTPHDEILRVKIERAKQLLVETDLSLANVAERTGFEHGEYFSVAFKRVVGQTPRDYREAHVGKLRQKMDEAGEGVRFA